MYNFLGSSRTTGHLDFSSNNNDRPYSRKFSDFLVDIKKCNLEASYTWLLPNPLRGLNKMLIKEANMLETTPLEVEIIKIYWL